MKPDPATETSDLRSRSSGIYLPHKQSLLMAGGAGAAAEGPAEELAAEEMAAALLAAPRIMAPEGTAAWRKRTLRDLRS